MNAAPSRQEKQSGRADARRRVQANATALVWCYRGYDPTVPNGAPGDHWYTDIAVHGFRVFSPIVDGMIAKLAERADEVGGPAAPDEPWPQSVRARVEGIVDGHLERIGYETLASRSDTVGVEWHLTAEELLALEADLQEYRDSLD